MFLKALCECDAGVYGVLKDVPQGDGIRQALREVHHN